MKVFEIYDKITNESFFIHHKEKFCREHGLTRRLLDYTYTGQRNHHKGFILKGKLEFIPSDDGEKLLNDSDILGYFIYPTETSKRNEENSDRIENEELKKELVKANRKIQSLTDKLRINRKFNREQDRKDNIQEDFINDVISILNKKVELTSAVNEEDDRKVSVSIPNSLIVQISDIHFGKNVDLPVNKFNFEIAKQRFKKYSESVLYYIKRHNVDKVVIALTGDLINLDSHFDSLLSNETNRAESFVEALDTLVDFINSIKKYVNNVGIVGVTGNESRIRTTEFHSNVDKIANNNFDMLLCKTLKRLFKNTNVYFINECDSLNYVFKVGKFNIAITHGDKLGKQSKDDILRFKTRMIEATNQPIDYVIFGHIHETLITSNYARSGSLCGMDNYAYNGLNISNGVASQNIYLVEQDSITGIEIKL